MYFALNRCCHFSTNNRGLVIYETKNFYKILIIMLMYLLFFKKPGAIPGLGRGAVCGFRYRYVLRTETPRFGARQHFPGILYPEPGDPIL